MKNNFNEEHKHKKHALTELNEQLRLLVGRAQQLELQNEKYTAKLAELRRKSFIISTTSTQNDECNRIQADLMTVNYEKVCYESNIERCQLQLGMYEQSILAEKQWIDEKRLKLEQELIESASTLAKLCTSYAEVSKKLGTSRAACEDTFQQYIRVTNDWSFSKEKTNESKITVQMVKSQAEFRKTLYSKFDVFSMEMSDFAEFWTHEWEDIIKKIRHDFEQIYATIHREMTTTESSKFDDNDINDDDLLAACDDVPLKKSDPIIPIVEVASFGFPFEPYQIQIDFMRSLYSTIQQRKHGIFESPTGTGKSLSLICGSLRWLFDEIQSWKDEYEELLKPIETKNETSSDNWLKRLMKRKEEETAREKRREELKVKIDLEDQYANAAKNTLAANIKKTKRDFDAKYRDLFNSELLSKSDGDDSSLSKDQFKIDNDDELSDEELIIKDNDRKILFDNIDSPTKTDPAGLREKKVHVQKIFFCTRTHSQISQFIGEVQKTKYVDQLRLVALGSRQNLCINESVLKLKSLTLINEKCLDLQKQKKEKKTTKEKRQKTACGCSFLQHDRVECLSNDILSDVQDIEDVVKLGRELNTCPYYATRAAIAAAHLVVLPYQTLMHKSTREACGIEMRDNVVIIDEAHNLPDAICAMHSNEINGNQLIDSYGQLSRYHEKYKARLTAKNLLAIKQLLDVQINLIKTLCSQENLSTIYDSEKWSNLVVSSNKTETSSTFDLIDYLSDAGIYVNLFQLIDYIKTNEITKKLHGFMSKYPVNKNHISEEKKTNESALQKLLQKQAQKQSQPNVLDEEQLKTTEQRISNSFAIFAKFLEALTNPRDDGKIILIMKETLGQCSIKYFALKTSSFFHDMVNEARSVIVADHIVPADNVLAIALPSGPQNIEFEFTAVNRSNTAMMDELGRVVVSLCSTIPDGLVVFFCSYDHLQKTYTYFEKTFVLNKILAKKKIFMEPKRSSDVDTILTNYTKSIKSGTGGLLFSIVGGKMSEGINFSDELARCVCIVGMPYPNIGSAEMVEKMRYLDSMKLKSTTAGETAGRAYYENTCWKAINQSIGRAIRHRGDYACLLLIDKRYSKANIPSKLPHWLANSFHQMKNFNETSNALQQFFVRRSNKPTSS
ncbi:unnamed protein product [Rotaria sp. Silwood1]|nr:unnamed protein product [Rotaria sp. Silwood1]